MSSYEKNSVTIDLNSEGVKILTVEFLTDDFQFYKNGEPTGHYARGHIIKEYSDSNTLLVECFSNGKRYEVRQSEVKHI